MSGLNASIKQIFHNMSDNKLTKVVRRAKDYTLGKQIDALKDFIWIVDIVSLQ